MVPTKGQTIFGYKLYLLVTLNGVILDFVLAPANVLELTVGVELLEEHTDLEVLGDKAFVSAPAAGGCGPRTGWTLRTLPRRNQVRQPPPPVRRLSSAARRWSRRSTASWPSSSRSRSTTPSPPALHQADRALLNS